MKTHLTTKNTVRRDCSKFSNIVEAKAKATEFCPQGVLEIEASPRGPHPRRAVVTGTFVPTPKSESTIGETFAPWNIRSRMR